MKLFSALLAASALLGATPDAPQNAELLHADRPLWTPGSPDVWPRPFTHLQSVGCGNIVDPGLWRYDPADPDEGPATWYRLGMSGALHCWMTVAEGPDPARLAADRPAFLISLGAAQGREMWALQLGARPGSDDLLLARPAVPQPIRQLEVLQRRCPRGHRREGPPLDVLSTRYCAINSQADLTALARQMARLPTIGTLRLETPAAAARD